MYLQHDTATAIRRVQEYLYEIHKYEGLPYSVARDGIYGDPTRKAVEDFQTRFGLPSTGIVDLVTFEALRSTAKKYMQEGYDTRYCLQKYQKLVAESVVLIKDAISQGVNYRVLNETKSAGLLSFLDSKYFNRWILVFASK